VSERERSGLLGAKMGAGYVYPTCKVKISRSATRKLKRSARTKNAGDHEYLLSFFFLLKAFSRSYHVDSHAHS